MSTRATKACGQAGVVLVLLLTAAAGAKRCEAQPRTDRGGTVLLFARVEADTDTDTAIQITNISNIRQTARCFYVDGRPTNPALPPSSSNPPAWTRQEFSIRLTRQQPTFWLASQGRQVDPGDGVVGLDPGAVPPLPLGFRGELLCVAVDDTNLPLASNALVGVATLHDAGTDDTAKYNAVGFEAGTLDLDNTLCLGSGAAGCVDPELPPCPQESLIQLESPMFDDPLMGAGSSTNVNLTLVACSQDLTAAPAAAVLNLRFTDTFELLLSSSLTMAGWIDGPLATFINPAILVGSTFYRTRIQRASGSPVLAVVQQLRASPGATPLVTSSMNEGYVIGQVPGALVIPAP